MEKLGDGGKEIEKTEKREPCPFMSLSQIYFYLLDLDVNTPSPGTGLNFHLVQIAKHINYIFKLNRYLELIKNCPPQSNSDNWFPKQRLFFS